VSRILVAGLCPLPNENTPKSYGPGIRTWQLAKSLAAAGHQVRIVAMRIGDAYLPAERVNEQGSVEGIEVQRVLEGPFLSGDALRPHLASGWPDAVVGATVYGSHALARQPPTIPFWADQFGHVMAEAQAKAALDRSNAVLPYFWRLLEPVMTHADRISVVSERQRWAAVGELGVLGRLTAETCGYEFTAVIPCAYVPERSTRAAEMGSRDVRAELGIERDAFVVLWSGSFNVWSDVETLFRALETVMQARREVHFLSTGAEITGHDETTYARFVRLVEGSPFRARIHLRGWVPGSDVLAHWAAADHGVLAEQPIYEGALGSKNRIVQWLGHGLPVLYNRMGELGELIAGERLGLTFASGDADDLAARIAWACEHRGELAEYAARARAYVAEKLTFEATTTPLVAWAADPRFAPDREGAPGAAAARGFSIQALAAKELLQALKTVPGVRRSQLLRRVWRWLKRHRGVPAGGT